MSKIMKAISFVVLLAFMLGSLTLTGCTKYANDDQLKLLNDTEAAALAAEKKIGELESEKADLERELQAKKAELDKANKEKETVKDRLSKLETN